VAADEKNKKQPEDEHLELRDELFAFDNRKLSGVFTHALQMINLIETLR